MIDQAWMKVMQEFGTAGLISFLFWKLVDKWAGRFLEVQNQQTAAMSQLAEAIKSNQADQHEVVLTVRVLAAKFEEQKEAMLAIVRESVRGK